MGKVIYTKWCQNNKNDDGLLYDAMEGRETMEILGKVEITEIDPLINKAVI